MRYFSILHIHEYGTTHSHVRCEGDFSGQFNSLDEDAQSVFLRESIGINFDPVNEQVYVSEYFPDAFHMVTL